MRGISDLPVAGKVVLLRCDLNVPRDGTVITDDGRIRASLPTIRALADRGARVLICAHLGRPKGEDYAERAAGGPSLRPAAVRLSELLGLPVPLAESSAGICKQIGSFATRRVSSVSCTATDRNGKKYELQFETDGSPIRVMRVRETPVPTERRRARQIEQFECRLKADAAKILPRDRTAYIIGCLGEDSQPPTTVDHQ